MPRTSTFQTLEIPEVLTQSTEPQVVKVEIQSPELNILSQPLNLTIPPVIITIMTIMTFQRTLWKELEGFLGGDDGQAP